MKLNFRRFDLQLTHTWRISSQDGVSKGTVDLYAPIVEWQSRTRFCCFAPGRHEVAIKVTGSQNPN